MIEVKEVIIDGKRFTIQQFSWKDSMKMELLTTKMLAPVVSVVELLGDAKKAAEKVGGKDDKDIDFVSLLLDMNVGKLVDALKGFFEKLDPDEFIVFFQKMTQLVAVEIQKEHGTIMQNLWEGDNANNVLTGSGLLRYKLIFEVMRANRFYFFALADGLGM